MKSHESAKKNCPREAAQTACPISVGRLEGHEVRLSMTRVVVAWGFGSMFANIVGGVVYAAFVRSLSTDDRLYGLLAAIAPMLTILQVIPARRIERTGRRKRLMVVNSLIGRSLWLVAALLPLFNYYQPERFSRPMIFRLVLICIASASTFLMLSGPAFLSWMSVLVPQKVRPAFFSARQRVGYCTAIGAALGTGFIADLFPTMPVLCGLMALAGVCGIIDIATFIGVKEPPQPDPAAQQPTGAPLLSSLGAPLRDPALRTFLGFICIYFFALGLYAPFLWLYALETLKLSKTICSLIIAIFPLLGIIATSGFWKEMIQSYGTRPLMRLCTAGLVIAPLAWLGAQPHEWIGIGIIGFFAGAMSGGLEQANWNLLTGLSPQVPRPTLIALFSIASGTSYAVASILAGQTTQYLHGSSYNFFGFHLLPYHALFLGALLMFIVNGFIVAPKLKEPAAASTLETVKEVIPVLAENFAHIITRPLLPRSH
jgi:hypothetical protein